MNIKIKRIGTDFQMEAVNEEGNLVNIDAAKEVGGTGNGMRPMQLLLTALGSCSAIDVLLILKKQRQQIEFFEVEITGTRKKTGTYSLFRSITIHFYVKGNVNPVKVENAVKMSLEKYCSVAKTLEPTAKINYKIIL
jgi:putative redox protein